MTEIISMLIPLAAVILGISLAMLNAYLDYRKKKDLYELYHRERLAAIDKGVDVPPLPPEFFGTPLKKHNPVGSLRRAVVLIMTGGALMLALWQTSGKGDFWWGLIPTAVGLAYLVVFLYERKLPVASEAPRP